MISSSCSSVALNASCICVQVLVPLVTPTISVCKGQGGRVRRGSRVFSLMINLHSFKYLLTEPFEGQDMWLSREREDQGERRGGSRDWKQTSVNKKGSVVQADSPANQI